MAEKILNARTQQKHDIEANWDKATNFIPKAGEIIVYDEDAAHSHPRMKVGDGTSYLADLEFLVNIDTTLTKSSAAADAKTVGDAITSINTIIENFDNIIAVDENNDGNVVLKRYNADGSEDSGSGAAAIHAEQHAADGIDPITPEMIGAMPDTYEAPVTSVNGETGDVTTDGGTYSGDFNNAKSGKTYWCNLSTCTNGPGTGGYGYLEVNAGLQRFTYYHNGSSYIRCYINTGWTSWTKINTTEYLAASGNAASASYATSAGTATTANAVAAAAVQIRTCAQWTGEIAKGGYSSTISITPTAVSGYRFLGPVSWGSNSSYVSVYGLYYYDSAIKFYVRNVNAEKAITPIIGLYGLYTKI